MNLKAYLANNNMTIKTFANMIECHPHYLSQVHQGKKKPSKKLLNRIIKATNGEVEFKFKADETNA